MTKDKFINKFNSAIHRNIEQAFSQKIIKKDYSLSGTLNWKQSLFACLPKEYNTRIANPDLVNLSLAAEIIIKLYGNDADFLVKCCITDTGQIGVLIEAILEKSAQLEFDF